MSLTKATYSMIEGACANVLDFGAVGDGDADDSAAIQAAIDSGASRIYIPAGTYLFKHGASLNTDGVNITTSNIEIFGDGRGTVLLAELTAGGVACQYIMSINRYDGGTSNPADNVKNVTIRDLCFQTQNNRAAPNTGGREFIYQLNLNACSDVLVDRCWFIGFQGDGIYLGSSNVSGVERHNENVTIQNCTFDGVDNLNRNGISVIDGTYVKITNNYFTRCTHTSMPGSIDIEPNSPVFHRVRSIWIERNTFTLCNGFAGHTALVLTAANAPGYTAQPEHFWITDNIFDSSNVGFLALNTITGYARPLNIVIKGNQGNPQKLWKFALGVGDNYIDGVSILNNTPIVIGTSWFGFDKNDFVKNVVISGNNFNGNGTSAAFQIIKGENISITGNVFSNFLGQAILMGYGGLGGPVVDSVKKVSIVGNVFSNIANDSGIQNAVSCVATSTDGTECVWMSNVWDGRHTFPAWRTDNTGLVVNDQTAGTESFGTGVLPDSFPAGVSYSYLNGDTGVPAGTGAGGLGVLHTIRMSTYTTLEKSTIQFFYLYNEGLKVSSVFMRRRQQSTNAWTTWYEIVGV